MTAIQGMVTSRVALTVGAVSVGVAGGGASLLPAPVDPQLDALMALYVLQAKSRELGLKGAKSDVERGQKLRHAAWEQQKQAMMQAAHKRHKGGFWSKLTKVCTTVAKVAAVVGAVALAVGTAGAATPLAALAIAGAVLSTAGFAQGEFHILGRSTTANWIGTALTIAGGLCSAGAAFGACAAGGEAAASTVEKAMQVGGRVSMGASGAATMTAGVSRIRESGYEADAQELEADALKAQLEQQKLDRMLRQILEAVDNAKESDERALGSLRSAIDTKCATLVMASGRA